MEITSKLIELEAELPVDTKFIENKLHELNITPLRWSIVKIKDNHLTISVACENLWYDVASWVKNSTKN